MRGEKLMKSKTSESEAKVKEYLIGSDADKGYSDNIKDRLSLIHI